MGGNKRTGIVIQDRDLHLLRELAVLRVIDRAQAQAVARFGSTTRANVRLLKLARAGLLRRFFMGTTNGAQKALYALSAKGARLVDVPFRGPRLPNDRTLIANFFVHHQLTVNDLYCALKYGPMPNGSVSFLRWTSFVAPLAPNIRLIPDGYVELQTPSGILAAYLEVDLGHETMRVWREKVRRYLGLAAATPFERRFRVLVIANSDRRLRSIQNVVSAQTEKLFWFTALLAIRRDGLFGSVWLRPREGEPSPLIKSS